LIFAFTVNGHRDDRRPREDKKED